MYNTSIRMATPCSHAINCENLNLYYNSRQIFLVRSLPSGGVNEIVNWVCQSSSSLLCRLIWGTMKCPNLNLTVCLPINLLGG